jgi:hypothetical protein
MRMSYAHESCALPAEDPLSILRPGHGGEAVELGGACRENRLSLGEPERIGPK